MGTSYPTNDYTYDTSVRILDKNGKLIAEDYGYVDSSDRNKSNYFNFDIDLAQVGSIEFTGYYPIIVTEVYIWIGDYYGSYNTYKIVKTFKTTVYNTYPYAVAWTTLDLIDDIRKKLLEFKDPEIRMQPMDWM